MMEEVKQLALVSRMVSDITGQEASEDEFVTLVVREHPAIDEPKALDVLPSEIEGLKEAGNVVTLEIKNGDNRELVVLVSDFRKIVPDEVVKKGRSTRGRRPGWSPKAS